MARKLKEVLFNRGLRQNQITKIVKNFFDKEISQPRMSTCINGHFPFKADEKSSIKNALIMLGIDLRTVENIKELKD